MLSHLTRQESAFPLRSLKVHLVYYTVINCISNIENAAIDLQVVINALLTDELAEAVEQCIFSNDWSMKDPLVLEAQAVERYSWHHEGDWTEFKITCLSNGSELHNLKDPLADVQLRNGTQGKAPVKLELIETVAKGGVALCGPTLTTANTWMLDFVQHYQRLGVDEFHFYLPQGPVLDAFIANQKSGGSDGKGSDKIASMRFKAFEHPDVRWHNFTASPESEAFNLRAAINDCLSRLKYSHQYAVIAQADRFLHVTQKSQITSIKDLVDKHLPESTAGIGLVNLHYPRDCPITSMFIDKDGMPRIWKGIFPDSYHLHYAVKLVREEAEAYWARQYDEPETLLLSKNPFEGLVTPVVRVKDVYSANAHGPEVLMPGATESLQILPHYMAHFKHIDYLGPTSCVFGTEFNSLFLINPEAMLHVMEA